MKGVWKENCLYEHQVGSKTTKAVHTIEALKSLHKGESL